ncbi:MAG TPA: collagen-like protein, partial [Candidatus Kapabacteria bacterium]|nr:collagen-like protein [Candidatus Kapabacteria bacterium]
MKNLFSILICSVVATTLFAQSPNKISYQTLIRNSSNQLVQNQNISIRITIVEDSVTGAGAYEESHNVKTNSNGLASIEIGGGTVTYGDFKFINWSKGVFFIKSEIDPTGGTNYTISGIQQLLSVPYAIYAREAREVHLPLAKESNSKISMSIATSYSEGDGAIGIIGAATNPLNFNIGVQGIANGRSTFSAGVDGRN